MGWIKFSNYSKRIWDITYMGDKIHLTFVMRESDISPLLDRIEVSWSADRFKGARFSIVPFTAIDTSWKLVFQALRKSLAYGLNPAARAATDRLLELNKNPNKPHPIHRRSSTCGKL